MSRIAILSISCEMVLIWMPQNLTNDYSTLVKIRVVSVRLQANTWVNNDWNICCHIIKQMIFIMGILPCLNVCIKHKIFWHLDWGFILGSRWKSSSVNFTANVRGSDMIDIINTKTQTTTQACAYMMGSTAFATSVVSIAITGCKRMFSFLVSMHTWPVHWLSMQWFVKLSLCHLCVLYNTTNSHGLYTTERDQLRFVQQSLVSTSNTDPLDMSWPVVTLDVTDVQGPVLPMWFTQLIWVNTLKLQQNVPYFTDNIFQCIFLNENFWSLNTISLKYVSEGPIDNMVALVQIMAWCWSGDKSLPDHQCWPSSLMHICSTRKRWVNQIVRLRCEKVDTILLVTFSNVFSWQVCSLIKKIAYISF